MFFILDFLFYLIAFIVITYLLFKPKKFKILLLAIIFMVSMLHWLKNITTGGGGLNSLTDNMGPYSNLQFGQNNKSSEIQCQAKLPSRNKSPKRANYNCPINGFNLDSNQKYNCHRNNLSLDGSSNTQLSLAMFSENSCSPNCCPSIFTCPGGCLCTTPKQLSWIQSRGNNRCEN